jgi:signal transduction histidine kinase
VVGRTVERWLSLTEKATEIERLFDETPDRSASLRDLLRETQTAVELAWPAATVRIDPPAEDVSVSERLAVVAEELCENGVKHADAEGPSVRVDAARVEDEWVELRVTDEGPGIPDHERTVLRNGEETALVHGSGMGLWLVRTVVRRVGGRLRVRDAPEGAGSTVVVSAPVVEADGTNG